MCAVCVLRGSAVEQNALYRPLARAPCVGKVATCGEVVAEREGELSEEQCVRAAGHLSEARAMYALAIEEIERALRRIEPASWELP